MRMPPRFIRWTTPGEFFSVAGPLSVPSGPQGWPVVVQAGGSEAGLRLGSELADVIFTVAQTRGKAIAFRDDIRARAAATGRNPDHVKVSLGVIVLVGETDDDVEERREALLGTLPIDELARGLLNSLGLPGRSLDAPIHADDVPAEPLNAVGSTGFHLSTRAAGRTLVECARVHPAHRGHLGGRSPTRVEHAGADRRRPGSMVQSRCSGRLHDHVRRHVGRLRAIRATGPTPAHPTRTRQSSRRRRHPA
jgi:hypothetical protein